jgi:hydroxypyruvate reductase
MDDNAEARVRLLALFQDGVAAVQADKCLPALLLQLPATGRTVLFALGKAAGHMARVAYGCLNIDEALIITRHGHMPAGWPIPDHARVIEAGHPNLDAASIEAGLAAEALVIPLEQGDRLIALISGGGSALMAAPIAGVSFAEKQAVNCQLLASGAPIADINRVRAALSRVKGGRLAVLASPAEVLTYVISDVPGDDPAYVASGPTCAMPQGESAASILQRYGIPIPKAVTVAGKNSHILPTIEGTIHICAKADHALDAMARQAAILGYEPVILGSAIEGDAVQIARSHATLAQGYQAQDRRVAIISGGETSVAITNPDGSGGRNLTYTLALALALKGQTGIAAFAADSDGIDGTSAFAGAMVLPDTLARAEEKGQDPVVALEKQLSAGFFEALGDTICSGPTGTNVNDLRAILVDPVARYPVS